MAVNRTPSAHHRSPTPGLPGHRSGSEVVLNYGSAPGELAVCLRHVGLIERSDLTTVRVSAPEATLDIATSDLTGSSLSVGGAVQLADAWWCRPATDRLLVMAQSSAAARAAGLLRALGTRRPALAVELRPDGDVLLGVVGLLTPALLRRLGLHGPSSDPRSGPPCTVSSLGPVEATWLLESDVSAIAAVPQPWADGARRAILRAGQELELGRVGHEAFEQYQLVERRRRARALRPI